jgi:hypothetical protein
MAQAKPTQTDTDHLLYGQSEGDLMTGPDWDIPRPLRERRYPLCLLEYLVLKEGPEGPAAQRVRAARSAAVGVFYTAFFATICLSVASPISLPGGGVNLKYVYGLIGTLTGTVASGTVWLVLRSAEATMSMRDSYRKANSSLLECFRDSKRGLVVPADCAEQSVGQDGMRSKEERTRRRREGV